MPISLLVGSRHGTKLIPRQWTGMQWTSSWEQLQWPSLLPCDTWPATGWDLCTRHHQPSTIHNTNAVKWLCMWSRFHVVWKGWLGSRVVSMLDSGALGTGFKSQPRCCRVSLRQTVHTHRASDHQEAKLVAALLRVARVTAGLAYSNGNLSPGLWLSPAGKNRYQLQNPTLGNWALGWSLFFSC